VTVPINLALDFFKESGDLPIAKFPATTELANIVGRIMCLDRLQTSNKSTLDAFVKNTKKRK